MTADSAVVFACRRRRFGVLLRRAHVVLRRPTTSLEDGCTSSRLDELADPAALMGRRRPLDVDVLIRKRFSYTE